MTLQRVMVGVAFVLGLAAIQSAVFADLIITPAGGAGPYPYLLQRYTDTGTFLGNSGAVYDESIDSIVSDGPDKLYALGNTLGGMTIWKFGASPIYHTFAPQPWGPSQLAIGWNHQVLIGTTQGNPFPSYPPLPTPPPGVHAYDPSTGVFVRTLVSGVAARFIAFDRTYFAGEPYVPGALYVGIQKNDNTFETRRYVQSETSTITSDTVTPVLPIAGEMRFKPGGVDHTVYVAIGNSISKYSSFGMPEGTLLSIPSGQIVDFTFSPNGSVFVLGSNRVLWQFDPQGNSLGAMTSISGLPGRVIYVVPEGVALGLFMPAMLLLLRRRAKSQGNCI